VGKLEQRELFDTLTRDASAMMQARACAFFLHDPASASLRLASYTGDAETLSPEGDLPLRSCLSASAVSARKPVSFADIQSPESLDLLDVPRDPAIRSVLAAPMLFEGDVMGVLVDLHGPVAASSTTTRSACAAPWRAWAPSPCRIPASTPGCSRARSRCARTSA
jgi:signal transduction protein with GAF and PtsI domain